MAGGESIQGFDPMSRKDRTAVSCGRLRAGMKPFTLWQLHERLWSACRRAGLREIRWHDLRHEGDLHQPRRIVWISLLAIGQLIGVSSARAQTGQVYSSPADGTLAPGAEPSAAAPPLAGSPPPPPNHALWSDVHPPPRLRTPMIFPSGPVVHLRSDSAVARLQVMQFRWMDVCTTPCDVPVDPNAAYRIGGGPVRPSEIFRMPRPMGQVLVDTRVGSTVRHWVGLGMIVGGLAAVLVGAYDYSEGHALQPDYFTGSGLRDTLMTEGIIYMVAGAGAFLVGLPLSASSTSVEVH
jgi:hypothetical protein